MAEGAEREAIGVAPRRKPQRRRLRPFAHWVAVSGAVGFIVSAQLGIWYAQTATYPVCTSSTPAVPGGNLLLLALLVLAPTTVIAGAVSVIKGPRRLLSVAASVGSIIVVAVLFLHYWTEMVDWSYGCGY